MSSVCWERNVNYQLLSLIENAPDGFQYRSNLEQRDVRRWPFALLSSSREEAESALAPFGAALAGLIVTFGTELSCLQCAPLLFHLIVPSELREHLVPILCSHLVLLGSCQQAENLNNVQSQNLVRAQEDSQCSKLEFALIKESLVEELLERRHAEEALRVSEGRFRSFVENANDVLFVITPSGVFSYVSPQWKDAFGYELSETVGQLFLPFVHPDDIPGCFAFLQRVMDTGEKQSGVEYRVLCKDGTYLWYTANASLILDPVNGTPSLFGIGRDITERKRIEEALEENREKFRCLSEAAYEAVFISENGQCLEQNKRAEEMFGYSTEEALGRLGTEWIVREDRNLVLQNILAGYELAYEVTGLRKDGSTFPALIRGRMMHFKNREVRVTSMTDITERKEHEKEQLKIEKLESLGVLAGGIAHDFNNILTGVMGNISFAHMFLDPTHKSFKPLVEAEKASVRATELAHQLLTFARGGEPVKKVVSLQQLVNESVSLVLRGSNIIGSILIPDTIHAIEADEGQMSQVFHNIIINAAQAMPGGGTLTVTAQNEMLDAQNSLSLHPGTYICLAFTDQGCGITADNLRRIFDPYFTTKSAGNGLGLASVHSIVSRHGGHISASSVVGKGTTFTLQLPSIGKTYSKYHTNSAPQTTDNHRGGSVLVMDDEKIIRDMTTEILEYLGYQVTTCENGAEALARYKTAAETRAPFSVVIMDLTIPGGMGGRETAELILEIDPKACLIVSSGYSHDPVMADYSAYGFSGAVAKPYNIKELGQLLSSVLSKR